MNATGTGGRPRGFLACAHLGAPPHDRRWRHARVAPGRLLFVEERGGHFDQIRAERAGRDVRAQLLVTPRRPPLGGERVEHILFARAFNLHGVRLSSLLVPAFPQQAGELVPRAKQQQPDARGLRRPSVPAMSRWLEPCA